MRSLHQLSAEKPHPVKDTLFTDNGPQYSSAEFAVFAKTWRFDHNISSPLYPPSNGKAEDAVKTVKRLFSKCKEAGRSEFQALLDWCNTPSAGMGTSPAQRLMGRRCKTLLQVAGSLLQPQYATEEDTRALIGVKKRQQHYYDKHSKPLPPISKGDTVRMKLLGRNRWDAGICTGQVAPRSYEVGHGIYRRNQRQLLVSTEEQNRDVQPENPLPEESPLHGESGGPTDAPPEEPRSESTGPIILRRSARESRAPEWHKDYHMPGTA